MSPEISKPMIRPALLAAVFTLPLAAHSAPDWKSAAAVMKERCYECHNEKKTKGCK